MTRVRLSPYLPQGKLKGFTMLSSKNKTIYAFTGVPYAQPPVGDLSLCSVPKAAVLRSFESASAVQVWSANEVTSHYKSLHFILCPSAFVGKSWIILNAFLNLGFKPPVAPSAWNGTLDASRRNSVCFQRDDDNLYIIGDEDCLHVAIYTRKLPSAKDATLTLVMFFVIGGGFATEDSTLERYGPVFLLNKKVLLVVPTFRVGVLGFLSTGDEVAPGNYGLKDIVRALEWTQENIKYFGGDPDRVTLAGGSSGGVSVSLLTLTNATKGLYHEYITHSGVALAPSLQRPKESYANDAFLLGEYLGCPTDTSELLVDCLRGLSVPQLVDTESVFRIWKWWPMYNWQPTVESDIEGALLTGYPAALFAEGKGQNLPWLTSTVRDEGLTICEDFMLDSPLIEEFLENIDFTLPVLLGYVHSSSNVTAFTEALKSYYLPDLTANRSLLMNNLTQLAGDLLYWYPTYSMLQRRLSDATCSQYQCSLEYLLGRSFLEIGGLTNLTGVLHGNETLYLFGDLDHLSSPPSYQYSEDDCTIVEEMVSMWTSFMINGEPTPADADGRILWKPYSLSQNYL